MAKLVIVESPSKAKTIQKYLGKGYEVVASMGHVRDLPKARLCVDVKDHFKPKYSVIKGKEKLVKELKEAAAKSDGVLLATDPDREGEAISWHLAYLLGLDENAPDRVTFNEITRTGVEEGMAHPRAIDLDLVNAQQARRILDRLVGYTLSPFLAKTIRRGLSAGRVQSVAVRMIVDREEEIRAFRPPGVLDHRRQAHRAGPQQSRVRRRLLRGRERGDQALLQGGDRPGAGGAGPGRLRGGPGEKGEAKTAPRPRPSSPPPSSRRLPASWASKPAAP